MFFLLLFTVSLIDILFLQLIFQWFIGHQNNWESVGYWKYLLSVSWSALFWLIWSLWGYKKNSLWYARISGVLLTLVFIISFGFKTEFFHLPNVNTFLFTLAEPLNSFLLIRDKVFSWKSFAILPLFPLFIFYTQSLLKTAHHFFKTKSPKVVAGFWGLSLVCLITISIFSLGWHRFAYPLTFDANFARIFFQQGLMLGGNKSNLRHPTRLEIPEHAEANYNVLIVINESLRADALIPGLDFTTPLSAESNAPEFKKLLADSQFVAFKQAYANSNTTNVSVPSILTGLLPEATSTEFHTYPTAWDYGKKSQAQTFLFTSQDWTWEHFDHFFFSKNIDHVFHRKTLLDTPLSNDIGIDDRVTLSALTKHLEGLDQAEPFLGVLQFNNTHPPFFGGEASLALEAFSKERYLSAVHLTDSLHGALIRMLDKQHFSKPTVVFITADHGENLKFRSIGRHNNFYEEMVRVPYGVYVLPGKEDSVFQRNWFQELKKNQNQVVQNVDILASIADLLEIEVPKELHGNSLFLPLDSSRVITGMGTCEIRKWRPEGFFIRSGDFKMVGAETKRANLFKLSQDPMEQKSLKLKLNSLAKTQLDSVLENNGAIKKICLRIGAENCEIATF